MTTALSKKNREKRWKDGNGHTTDQYWYVNMPDSDTSCACSFGKQMTSL